jgi:hypothetical protein
MLGGWAYGAIYRDSTERTTALAGWIDFYNHRRPHGAISHKPPTARLNELNNLQNTREHVRAQKHWRYDLSAATVPRSIPVSRFEASPRGSINEVSMVPGETPILGLAERRTRRRDRRSGGTHTPRRHSRSQVRPP